MGSANPLLEQRSRAVQAAVVTFLLLEMPADNELSAILNRRNQINDTLDNGGEVKQRYAKVSVYTEFTEFTRKEIKDHDGDAGSPTDTPWSQGHDQGGG